VPDCIGRAPRRPEQDLRSPALPLGQLAVSATSWLVEHRHYRRRGDRGHHGGVQEETTRVDVAVLNAVAAADGIFASLGLQLRKRSDVREVLRTFHCGPGPRLDFATDAELAVGEAISWGLEVRFDDAEWVIESSIRRSHAHGQDLILELPTRYAVDFQEFTQELLAAARMVTQKLPQDSPMFPREGYGDEQ
jgi:hypothetical protein